MKDLLKYINRCKDCDSDSGGLENPKGQQGPPGDTGATGLKGQNGLNGTGINPVISSLAPGEICECGGTHVDLYGVDGENDGIVIGSFDICSGCPGADATFAFKPFYWVYDYPTDAAKFVQSGGTKGLGLGIYAGYALSNGNNGTIDMRGLFPMPYSDTDVTFSTVGDSAGAKTVTLAKANLPTHQHTVSTSATDSGTIVVSGGAHTHTYTKTLIGAPINTSGGSGSADTQYAGDVTSSTSHSHTVTGSTGNGTTDGLVATPVNKLPPYRVLLLIQKL